MSFGDRDKDVHPDDHWLVEGRHTVHYEERRRTCGVCVYACVCVRVCVRVYTALVARPRRIVPCVRPCCAATQGMIGGRCSSHEPSEALGMPFSPTQARACMGFFTGYAGSCVSLYVSLVADD